MIAPTIDGISYALTRVVASLDDDPYGTSGDVLLTRAVADELREAHAAAHHLRRMMAGGVKESKFAQAGRAIAVCDGSYKKAAEMLGINVATLFRWRQAGEVRG
jgi:hypothetical protein